jgi:ABC-type sugar transport system permease subunit
MVLVQARGADPGGGARRSAGPRGRRFGRWWFGQYGLGVLVVVAWLPIVVIVTLRATVLDPAFYSQSLADTHAYDRVYTQVLPDPAVDDLLAGLPIDRTLITANLRTVLPPSTVEGMTNEQIDRIVRYLRADTDDVALTVDLEPLFGNISGLANRYLAGDLGSGTTYQVASVSTFTGDLLSALDDIAAGRPPTSLPTMELTPQETDRVLSAVLARFDEPTRTSLAAPLRALLLSGDIGGALALVGPVLFQGDEHAVAELRRHLRDGTVLDIGLSLSDLRDKPAVRALDRLHDVSELLVPVTVGCGLALAGGLVGVGLVARARGRSPVRALGVTVLAAGGTAGLLGVLLRITLPNPLAAIDGPGSTLPPGAGAVLADFGRTAYGDIEGDYLRVVGWTLLVGAVATGLSLLVALSVRLDRSTRRRRLAAATAVVAPLVIAVTWTAFPGAAADGRQVCNGSASLCGRHYDEVSYAAAHNAMADSEDRFLGPSQDPSLVHQLDLGVRGLLLDVHHWTTPAEVDAFLATLTPSARGALEPLTRGAVSARPGLWLCHDLCQLGALDLTTQLAQVGAWMDRNPTEVVTLILQDEAPAAEIAGAAAAAGLAGKVLTPPADPGGAWPTLRTMISTGRRLVVFTESQDTPGSFLRSFYRYGSDTPFDARTPADLAGCAVKRGSADSRLLLVNNWLTGTAPSRRSALAVNASATVLRRAERCERDRGRRPTFVAVDFVNIGDLTHAIDVLNGVA